MERRRKYKSHRSSKNTCYPLKLLTISLHNSQRDLPISTSHVRRVVSFLLDDLKISTDEIILHFVTESKICRLHKKYFNDSSSTDCITFPLDPPSDKKSFHHILGEVFICPKTALTYATRFQINPYEELYRYLIHCILHLIGYDDIRPADLAKMRRKERACLKKLALADLLDFATF
jgi:probable rRNA maturation factor